MISLDGVCEALDGFFGGSTMELDDGGVFMDGADPESERASAPVCIANGHPENIYRKFRRESTDTC